MIVHNFKYIICETNYDIQYDYDEHGYSISFDILSQLVALHWNWVIKNMLREYLILSRLLFYKSYIPKIIFSKHILITWCHFSQLTYQWSKTNFSYNKMFIGYIKNIKRTYYRLRKTFWCIHIWLIKYFIDVYIKV